jgi:hypothetical protein
MTPSGIETANFLPLAQCLQTTALSRAPTFVRRDYIIMVHGPHLSRVRRQKTLQIIWTKPLSPRHSSWEHECLCYYGTQWKETAENGHKCSCGIYSLTCIRSNKITAAYLTTLSIATYTWRSLQMKNLLWSFAGMTLTGEKRSTRKKALPIPLRSSQILYGLEWDRTLPSPV